MVTFYVIFKGSLPANTVRLRLRYDTPSQFLRALCHIMDDFISSSGGLPLEVKLEQITNEVKQ